jgi:hypothetical protein
MTDCLVTRKSLIDAISLLTNEGWKLIIVGCMFVSLSFHLNNIFINIHLVDKLQVNRESIELYYVSLIYKMFAF